MPKEWAFFQMALSREQAGPGHVASDGASRRGPVDRVWELLAVPTWTEGTALGKCKAR